MISTNLHNLWKLEPLEATTTIYTMAKKYWNSTKTLCLSCVCNMVHRTRKWENREMMNYKRWWNVLKSPKLSSIPTYTNIIFIKSVVFLCNHLIIKIRKPIFHYTKREKNVHIWMLMNKSKFHNGYYIQKKNLNVFEIFLSSRSFKF
jgi:hypothetical protein